MKKHAFLNGKGKAIRNQGGLLLMLVLLSALFTLLNRTFLTGANWMNIVRQASVSIIVAMGMTFVMISGEMDLSIGGIACVTGMVVCKLMTSGVGVAPAVLLGLLLGVLFGFASGFLITTFHLPAMIVTLAMMNIANGVASLLTGGTAIYGLPDRFQIFGRGMVGPVPVQVIIMFVIVIVCFVVMNKTLLGRYAFAIGGSNEVARLAGIQVRKYKIIFFMISGLLSALGGIILTSRLMTGQPNLASNMMMDTITAVVLGGTAMSGGSGSIVGSFLGALLLTIITNGLTIVGVNSFWQLIISALILLLTIIFRQKKTSD